MALLRIEVQVEYGDSYGPVPGSVDGSARVREVAIEAVRALIVWRSLLGPRAVPRNFVEELVASAWKVMAGAARSEEAGAVQRAHLLKLLQKRPLKCSHVARMQSLLDYSPMKCVERAGVQQKPPQRHPAAGSAASHRRRLRQTSDNPLGSPSRAQRRGHRSGTALPLRARILLGSARFRFRAPAAG